jgi:ribosomal protein L23
MHTFISSKPTGIPTDLHAEADQNYVIIQIVHHNMIWYWSQIELKRFLESVYQFDVAKVHTLNYEGKKKMDRKTGKMHRKPDWKKAYVMLNQPINLETSGTPAPTPPK